MTWEEFKRALEALENGAELLEFHASALDKEKQFGIQKYSEKDKEAAKLRKYKGSLKELGWDGESDPEEFIANVKDKLEGRQAESNTALTDLNKQFKQLQKEFEKTQGELQTEREQRTTLQKQNKTKTIESALQPKLAEQFYGSQFIIKALIADGQVDLDEGGQVVFKKRRS